MAFLGPHHHARLLDDAQALATRVAQYERELHTLSDRPEYADVRELGITAGEQRRIANRLLSDQSGLVDAERLLENSPPYHGVLVVDDYEATREALAKLLRNAGFAVLTAKNGLEGVIVAHEMRPTVIIMDLSMPVLDGFEATRLIKALDSTCRGHVIAHSQDGMIDSPARPLCAAVLPKPAMPEVVIATIQRLVAVVPN